ncbi:MAG: NAD(P)-dependent oxidoreductase [Candidatus Omnitrophica bacterium]|nr:NAD(P)-dependent oxidoreductase [Candidatus Omnitrophota bacterium]
MDVNKESKILIVGGLGYVGGRLAHYLASQGYADVALTTTREQYPEWAQSYEIGHLDLRSESSIRGCLEEIQPEILIHLGGMQQAQCQTEPEGAAKVNAAGMDSLLYVALDLGVRRCVYLSSFQVYGDFTGTITEETPPKPRTVYAETKLRGEDVARRYREKGLSVAVLRLSNAYGYPMDNSVAESVWSLAVNAFCRRVVQEGRLTIKSNQYRDFIPMFDAVRGIEHAMNMEEDRLTDGLFNLGGDNCVQIKEIAQRVVRIYADLDPEAEPVLEGPTEDLDKVFQPFDYRIDKIKDTGFELQGDMDQTIRTTLQFCREHMSSSLP